MNRKNFLSVLPSLAFVPGIAFAEPDFAPALLKSKIPAYLKEGDTIAITCPAGYITPDEVEPAIALMKSWGFDVLVGKTVGARDFTFGGSDNERLADLQEQLDNPTVKAIMCARGGYGAIRILDQLDFSFYQKHPKWIIGFSDITIIHCHIGTKFKIASIHSKMCNSFPQIWGEADSLQQDTINSIKLALTGQKMIYKLSSSANNIKGIAIGELVGGNLRCIENLSGSDSAIDTKGKILFLEDTGEALYSIDRMFYNLKRSGKLAKLKGLLIGGFKLKTEDGGDVFGKTIVEIVLEKVAGYEYPVVFDFPVGHQKANYALKCGVAHQLTVDNEVVILEEI